MYKSPIQLQPKAEPRKYYSKKGATPSSAQRAHVRATISEVLHDGSSGQPWRALGQMSNGHMVLISSKKPLDAISGDDIQADGLYRDSGHYEIPNELVIGAGASSRIGAAYGVGKSYAQMRMGRMVAKGAKARSFGRKKLFSPIVKHPGFVGITRSNLGSHFSFANGGNGVTIIKAVTKNKDAVLGWVTSLMKDIPEAGNVHVIDPLAFTPANIGRLPVDMNRSNPEDALFANHSAISNMRRDLSSALPESLLSQANDDVAKWVLTSSPLAFRLGEYPTVRPHIRNVVIPFDPYDTYSTLWQYLSGFPATVFAPKDFVEQKNRRGFIAAHELAHTQQDNYGVSWGNSLRDIHLGECFADSFSVLANAKRLNNLKDLELFGAARHALLIRGGLTHTTGRAYDAALNEAKILMANNSLRNMSTDELLKRASKIAKKYAFTQRELTQIEADRKRIFRAAGIPFDAYGRAQDKTGGMESYKAMKATVANGASGFANKKLYTAFKAAIKGLEESSYNADDLKIAARSKKAFDIYKKDLSDTLLTAGSKKARNMILEMEYAQHTAPARISDLIWKVASGKENKRLISERKKAIDAAKVSRKNYGRAKKRVPVTTIRRNCDTSMFSKSFAKLPQERLKDWLFTMKEEVSAVKAAMAAPHDATKWQKANQFAMHRKAASFALRVGNDGWAEVLSLRNADLTNNISDHATRKDVPYHVSSAPTMLRHLENKYQRIMSHAATAALINGGRRPNIPPHNPPKP